MIEHQQTTYRHEVLSRIFRYIRSTESFSVIGAASTGKTRLLDALTRKDVQKQYLEEKTDHQWLIRVDLNRLAVKEESWAFYELLFSSILLELNNHDNLGTFGTDIAKLDSEIIQHRDLLLALRFFELTVNKLCQVYDTKLCFLFDEFDEAYQNLPRETFLQLRAVRDANKSRVTFGLFLRTLPERLRPSLDNESFYELLSRNTIGLGPYTRIDALQMIQSLEVRKDYPLASEQREKLVDYSGGHSGIIQGLFSTLIDTPRSEQKFETPGWMEWLGRQPAVMEECRKLWAGLSEEEQEALSAAASGDFSKISLPIERLLITKGLIRTDGDQPQFFSRIFEQYVKGVR